MTTTVNTSTVNKAKSYQIKESYSKYRTVFSRHNLKKKKNGKGNLRRNVVR